MPSIRSLPMRHLGQLLSLVDRFIPTKVLPPFKGIIGSVQGPCNISRCPGLISNTCSHWSHLILKHAQIAKPGLQRAEQQKEYICTFFLPLISGFLYSDLGCQPESTGDQPEQRTRLAKPPPAFSWPPPASPRGLIRTENCLYITSILQDSGPFERSKYDFSQLGFKWESLAN